MSLFPLHLTKLSSKSLKLVCIREFTEFTVYVQQPLYDRTISIVLRQIVNM